MVKQNILVSYVQTRIISYMNERKRETLNNNHVLNFKILDSHDWPLYDGLFVKANYKNEVSIVSLYEKREKLQT